MPDAGRINVFDLSEALRDTGIDEEAFAQWLDSHLVTCRVAMAAQRDTPPLQVEIEWLRDAVKDLERNDFACLRQMPDRANAGCWYAAHAIGSSWDELVARKDAPAAAECIRAAIKALQRQRAERGRKSLEARDVLVAAMYHRLRALGVNSMEDAAPIVHAVLLACRVQSMGSSPRALLRAIKKASSG